MRQKENEKKIVQMRNRIRVKRMNKWPILTWSNNQCISYSSKYEFSFHVIHCRIPKSCLHASLFPKTELESVSCFSCLERVSFFWKSNDVSLGSWESITVRLQLLSSSVFKLSFLIVTTSFAIEHLRSSLTSCNLKS